MSPFPYKTVRKFKLSQLHKKIGQLFYLEPCDSDISEGNFMAQLSFFDAKAKKIYVIQEWDTRKPKSESILESDNAT